MARTIQEIEDEQLTTIANDATLSEMSSNSATALYRLFARVVAKAIATLENLFDLFRAEVDADLAAQKAHTLRWYREKALAFQLGYDLVEGEDYYDNTGEDPDQVADAKIVEYAAVVENDGELVIKVNQDSAGPAPLGASDYDAFVAYIAEIKDAGVKVEVRNANPDRLKLTIDVYYDPTILDSTGARLDGADSAPAETAIDAFLRSIPFNGRFVKSHLVDALQLVEGISVPVARNCQAARFDSGSFVAVDVDYDPFSGFLKIYSPGDLVLNYIAYV